MNRCTYCNRLLWLGQDKSPGKSMHFLCWMMVMRMIQRENQAQYNDPMHDPEFVRQGQLRAKEEDLM